MIVSAMKIMMIIMIISIYVTTKNIKYWRAPEKTCDCAAI